VRYTYTQNSEMRFQKIYFTFTPPAGISGILVQMESAPEFFFPDTDAFRQPISLS